MKTNSYWIDSASLPSFPKLEKDLRADVLVVGGGITGLTAAYLLLKSGLSIAVMERGRLAQAETGHTTAHLTYATDARLSDLVKTFGRDHAQAAWDAGASAMSQIQSIVGEIGIDCELRAAPAFLLAAPDADLEAESKRLRDEAAVAASMGFDVAFVETAPLFRRPAICFANQLKFHPLKYLAGLVGEIVRLGGHIFENTDASQFQSDPRCVIANGHTVSFDFAVIATHVPLQGNRGILSATLLQTKLAAYSTYAVEARASANVFADMMWWDTANPYLYLRVDRRERSDMLILGGEDHKTGQESDTEVHFQRLEHKLRGIAPDAAIERRWSGQVIESVDGLPYIGEVGDGQFIVTGFGGNGMTFGTLAGMMARDAATGLKNPWRELFAIERKTLSTTWDYLRENSDYPFYFAKGHLAAAEAESLEAIARGTGKIVRVDGHKAAAFRDEDGKMHIHSAICPHLGCVVAWNAAERTWDCPCHGSRFQATGEVMNGPAEKGLEKPTS